MLNISKNRLEKEVRNERYFVLRTLNTPKHGRTVARILISVCLLFMVFLFLPWQQNIRGTGKVTAFTPGKRPQTVETAIPGRIIHWKIREGQYVNHGDTILTLAEIKEKFFDPDLLLRLEEQIAAKEANILSKERKASNLRERIKALNQFVDVKLRQAKNKIRQNEFKLTSDSVDFEAEKIRFRNAENQYERNKQLFEAGNITLTKYQDVETKYQEGKMKLISAENVYLESETELFNSRFELTAIRSDYDEKISKAESDLNTTLADLFESQASLAKLKNEYANMRIRNDQYQVVAPQSGFIVKTVKSGIGQTIKEGEAVATIMPDEPDISVEMYVKAMDVPLISKDRKVRIQFDGWPALQFSGWPNVAVGTFGGVVKVIDYVNSEAGEFRILVTPDPDDEPWPYQLRIGSGTKGWVMLDTVPVWYEIWRQLNGFPPSLYEAPEEGIMGGKELKTAGK